MLMRISLIVTVAGTLSGCGVAALPLVAAATNMSMDKAVQSTQQIPQMNCSQLREKWKKVSSPLQMVNPYGGYVQQRGTIRAVADKKNCALE